MPPGCMQVLIGGPSFIVAGSIRRTALSPRLATQTAPAAPSVAHGIVPAVRCVMPETGGAEVDVVGGVLLDPAAAGEEPPHAARTRTAAGTTRKARRRRLQSHDNLV